MSADTARAIAEGLRADGADTGFGVPGGGPNLDVVGALDDIGLRFVLTHGETAAAIMAGTYGLLTGRAALALATRGPGATSAANGVAQATLDRFPLLMVTDSVAASDVARIDHQRLDQQALMRPITKWSGALGHLDPAGTVRGALALAAATPAGAVHLDDDPSVPGDRPPPEPRPLAIEAVDIARARTLLDGAKRPVAIVGTGALPDATDVRATLTTLGWPVLTTYQATGVVHSEGRQGAGLFTNGASEAPLLRQADLIVAIGLDVVEPIPAPWPYDAPVVALQAVPVTSSYLPASVLLTGPVGELLTAIAPDHGSDWPDDAGALHRERVRAELREHAPNAGLSPLELVDTVRTHTPPDTMVTVDAGAHFLAVMPMWPTSEPMRLLISNGLATMGFALPAAIAAALARPGTPVVCFVGDGGLGMTLAELETLARLRLPVTVVVFDDAVLSLIRVKQRAGHGGERAVGYGPVDFAAVARGMGLDATTVDDAAALSAALRARWTRPRLIDAHIDPTSYAHLIAVTRG